MITVGHAAKSLLKCQYWDFSGRLEHQEQEKLNATFDREGSQINVRAYLLNRKPQVKFQLVEMREGEL